MPDSIELLHDQVLQQAIQSPEGIRWDGRQRQFELQSDGQTTTLRRSTELSEVEKQVLRSNTLLFDITTMEPVVDEDDLVGILGYATYHPIAIMEPMPPLFAVETSYRPWPFIHICTNPDDQAYLISRNTFEPFGRLDNFLDNSRGCDPDAIRSIRHVEVHMPLDMYFAMNDMDIVNCLHSILTQVKEEYPKLNIHFRFDAMLRRTMFSPEENDWTKLIMICKLAHPDMTWSMNGIDDWFAWLRRTKSQNTSASLSTWLDWAYGHGNPRNGLQDCVLTRAWFKLIADYLVRLTEVCEFQPSQEQLTTFNEWLRRAAEPEEDNCLEMWLGRGKMTKFLWKWEAVTNGGVRRKFFKEIQATVA